MVVDLCKWIKHTQMDFSKNIKSAIHWYYWYGRVAQLVRALDS